MVGVRRPWDGGDVALLEQPAERDLRGGLAVLRADLLQRLVTDDPALGERGVRRQHEVAFDALLDEVRLVEERVVLHLVREDRRVLQRLLHEARGEVAHPDVTCSASLAQLVHRLQRRTQRHVLARPVDEQEVDRVGPELAQALLVGATHRVGRDVARRHLRREEDLVAVHVAVGDGPPDLLLVAVHLRGVDVAVAELEGVADRLVALPSLELPGPEAERGDPHALNLHVPLAHARLLVPPSPRR